MMSTGTRRAISWSVSRLFPFWGGRRGSLGGVSGMFKGPRAAWFFLLLLLRPLLPLPLPLPQPPLLIPIFPSLRGSIAGGMPASGIVACACACPVCRTRQSVAAVLFFCLSPAPPPVCYRLKSNVTKNGNTR